MILVPLYGMVPIHNAVVGLDNQNGPAQRRNGGVAHLSVRYSFITPEFASLTGAFERNDSHSQSLFLSYGILCLDVLKNVQSGSMSMSKRH